MAATIDSIGHLATEYRAGSGGDATGQYRGCESEASLGSLARTSGGTLAHAHRMITQ